SGVYEEWETRRALTASVDERANEKRGADNADQHCSISPRAACDAREGLSGVSRRGCDGQMASAERVHGQGAPSGRQSWWQLQDVVHEDRKSTRLNSSHVAISYA